MPLNLRSSSFSKDTSKEKHKNCNKFSLPYRIPNPHQYFTRLAARHNANLEIYDQNKSYNYNLNPYKSFSSSCLSTDLSLVQSESRLNQSCSALERFAGDFYSTTMDYEQICGRSRRQSSGSWMKYLFFIFIGLIVLWYVNGRIEESRGNIEGFHTDLCDVKSQMSVMKDGYEKDTKQRLRSMQKDTEHKLEVIENLLNEIKLNQQAHPARPAEGSSGDGSLHMIEINRDDPVYHMVRQVLQEYDADKTGKVDFALESAGGSIISSGDTEPYAPSGSTISLFGIPLCSSLHGPRAIIQASSLPGECWAFKGSKGTAVIRLLGPVYIHCVSMEHISRAISPSGEIDSAPREFSIWGLQDADSAGRGRKLGEFSYNINGSPIQFFPVGSDDPYEYIEFKVHSNQGNPVYTCVYRLRVHGQLESSL